MRSALSASAGYCACIQGLVAVARTSAAYFSSAERTGFDSAGLAQNAVARFTSSAGSAGTASFCGSSRAGSQTYWAISQRPRNVAVSSQEVSSQPETFGGMNRYWPALWQI